MRVMKYIARGAGSYKVVPASVSIARRAGSYKVVPASVSIARRAGSYKVVPALISIARRAGSYKVVPVFISPRYVTGFAFLTEQVKDATTVIRDLVTKVTSAHLYDEPSE
jgi:hypothetical protein